MDNSHTTTPLDWSGCWLIQQDPEKMGGLPTVADMRITPETIIDHHEDGHSPRQIIELFPCLTESQIRTVLEYAAERGYLTRPAA